MNVVRIGKGMCRIIVRSNGKRERLAKIPEIYIEGNRVIFPEWLIGNVQLIVKPPLKKKQLKPEQTELF